MSEPKLLRRPLPPKGEAVLLKSKRKDREVTSAVHPVAFDGDTESKGMPREGEDTDSRPSVSTQSHCILFSLPDSIGGTSGPLDYHSSCLAATDYLALSSPSISRDAIIPVQHTGPPSFPLQKRRIPLGLKLPALKRHQLVLPADFILKGFTAGASCGLQRVISAQEKPTISNFNYEVLTSQLIQQLQRSDQQAIHTICLPDPEFPFAGPRQLERQLLLETFLESKLAAYMAPEISEETEGGETISFPQTEPKRGKKKRVSYKDSAADNGELSLVSGTGCRSQYGAEYEEEELMTKAEMAVLCCLMHKRTGLSLKGYFLPRLPDLSVLTDFLLYLNLSFNELQLFPTEVCDLIHLQILKLRNNPIKFIPEDIKKMKCLKTLIISFNLLTELPSWLFALPDLEFLDASYNELECISNEIRNARNLSCLIVEGNLLWALPSGILKVNLKRLRVENNFLHPLFWREFRPRPQRLTDMAALCFVKSNLQEKYPEVPENIQELLRKDERKTRTTFQEA